MIRPSIVAAGLAALVAAFPAAAKFETATVDAKSGACRERPVEPPGRPRVGLVLGGGGARGIAHISVLRTLEQMHVPVDCIAGTSMGSLVGALYASGMSVDQIEQLVTTLDWKELFNDALARPERSYRRKRDDDLVISQPGVGVGSKGVKIAAGILSGERILLLFEKMVEPVATIEDFDHLPIPYRAVAADINNGAVVVVQGGDLALAMRASMSLPGIFPPIELGELVLVDGGVARNLPVDVARNMGADIVIAVDVGTPLAKVTTQTSALGIADQVTGLLIVANTKAQIASLGERDVLISPPLGDKVGTADFDKGKEALAIGQAGVDAMRDRLARLSLPEAAYAQNLAVRTGRSSTLPVIEFVRLDNQSRYSDAVLLGKIEDPVGKPLDSARLEHDMHGLFGYNTLSLSTYEVVQEDGRTGVVLHVRDKAQGPNYLEVGLSMSSDFEGRFDFNVRAGILQSPINDTGGELRYLLQLGDETQALAEYYQPFGPLGHWFFGARGEYDDLKINQFDSDGNKLAELGASQLGGRLVVGKEFGNYGALNLVYQRYTGEADVIVGQPQPGFDFDTGLVTIGGDIDRLDSVYFPRDGYTVRAGYSFSRESLGADTAFEQFDLDSIGARSFGKHAVQFGLRYHVTTSGVAPIQSLYRLGGFSRLAGFQPNELTGQDYAVLIGGYQYKLANLFLRQKAYAGGTVEYGNAFQRRSDMDFGAGIWNGSVYAGIDSVLGPILLGAGVREGGHHTVFLVVGQRF